MSLLNKLIFWKKDHNFDQILEKELGSIAEEKNSFKDIHTEKQLFENSEELKPSVLSNRDFDLNHRELELINSKLDTIKAMLASIEQRLANLEQVNKAEEKKSPRLW